MKNIKGLLYIVLASVSFGIMPILAKLAYSQGANPYSVLFLRFLFASIMLLYYLLKKGISLKLDKTTFLWIILLGVFGYSATSGFLFVSYNYISVGLATMIMYTYPIIVTFFSTFIYKEKIYLQKIIALSLSVLGVYVLIGVGKEVFSFKGISFALMSAIFYSIYVLGASSGKLKQVNSYVMTFYLSISASATMLLLGLKNSSITLSISFYGIVCIMLLAFISTVVALMAFLEGVRLIGPSNASILSTLEPIVSLVLGWIILKEAISISTALGSLLILSSIIILTRYTKKEG